MHSLGRTSMKKTPNRTQWPMLRQVYSSKELKLINQQESWITNSIKKNMRIIYQLWTFKMTSTFLKITFSIINSTNKMKPLPILWVTPNTFRLNRNHQMREWRRQVRKLSRRKPPRTSRPAHGTALGNPPKKNGSKTLEIGAAVHYQRIMLSIHCKQVLAKIRLLQNTANRFSLQIHHSILCKTKITRPLPSLLKVSLGIQTQWWGRSTSCSHSWTFWENISQLLQRFKILPRVP